MTLKKSAIESIKVNVMDPDGRIFGSGSVTAAADAAKWRARDMTHRQREILGYR